MTAVDLDALDAARAAATALVTEDQAAGWQESLPDELVDALLAGPLLAGPLADLVADARKLRALREWLDKLIATAPAMWHGDYPVSAVAVSDLLGVLALAAALTSEGERE